jgi:hypothetical protein
MMILKRTRTRRIGLKLRRKDGWLWERTGVFIEFLSVAWKMVVPRGNAPRSSAYQASALLLSYETIVNCGFEPNRFTGRNTRLSRCVGRIRMTRFGL